MIHKYEDLVIIPKSVLEDYTKKKINGDQAVALMFLKAQPLTPLIEDAFKRGHEVTRSDGSMIPNSKQEFLNKGIDL